MCKGAHLLHLLFKVLQEPVATFSFNLFKKTKCILRVFYIFDGYKSKVVYHEKLGFQSGVRFLIGCILDHAEHHLAYF